jgi:hypothetical protein
MPDVLWHLKESKSTKDFNQDVRDITNFLENSIFIETLFRLY